MKISWLIQSKSALHQRCSDPKTQCSRGKKSALNFSVLNGPNWKKIKADQLWNSADIIHVLWFSADKLQIYEQRGSVLIISEISTCETSQLGFFFAFVVTCSLICNKSRSNKKKSSFVRDDRIIPVFLPKYIAKKVKLLAKETIPRQTNLAAVPLRFTKTNYYVVQAAWKLENTRKLRKKLITFCNSQAAETNCCG